MVKNNKKSSPKKKKIVFVLGSFSIERDYSSSGWLDHLLCIITSLLLVFRQYPFVYVQHNSAAPGV